MAITRYRVEGLLKGAPTEAVYSGLKKNTIPDIDDDTVDKASGWTSFEHPYFPSFEGSSFVFGSLFLFALRIDRKSVSPNLIKKHVSIETAGHLKQKRFLSRDEKTALKDKVTKELLVRVPSSPNVYDVIWNYEPASVLFMTRLKSANEEFETLFRRSFNLGLIRVFPYTAADLLSDLPDPQRDMLMGLSPTQF
jgi:recombination associated protein RdgC